MHKKNSIFSLLLSILLMIPFSIILAACGEQPARVVGISVLYGTEDITTTGKTLYVDHTDQVNIDSHLKVNLNYDNGETKVIGLKTETSDGYVVATDLPSTLVAGNTYTYRISYGNYPDIVISVVVDKAQNTINITKDLNKVYDKTKVTLSASDYSLLFDVQPTIKWYSVTEGNVTELTDAPSTVGDYKVVVSVPDTDNFRACTSEKLFSITQATPLYTTPVFSEILYSTNVDRLSDIVLPTGFSWQPNQELSLGTNEYNVTFTPADTKNYKVVSNISVLLSYKELVAKPTIVGDYYYNPNGEVVVQYSSFQEDAIVLAADSDAEVQRNYGTYKIKLKLVDATKYAWEDKTTANLELVWTISQLQPSFSVPQIANQHYTEDTSSPYYDTRVTKLSEIELPEEFEWKNPSQTLAIGSHNYLAKYVPLDSNYESKDNINIEINYYLHLIKPSFETISYYKDDDGMVPNIINFDDKYMTVTSINNQNSLNQVSAGIYAYQFSLKQDEYGEFLCWSDDAASTRIISWIINKQTISTPTIKNDNVAYTGENITLLWDNELDLTNNQLIVLEDNSDNIVQSNVGTYNYYLTLKDTTNYKWDSTNDATISITWTIIGATPDVVIPTISDQHYTDDTSSPYYDTRVTKLGEITLPTGFSWLDAEANLVLGDNIYLAKYTPSNDNYNEVDNIEIHIKYYICMTIPSINATDYSSEIQTPEFNNLDETYMSVVSSENGEDLTQTDAGEYDYTVTLNNDYIKWSDGTQDSKTITWTINKINPTYIVPTIPEQYSDSVATLADIDLPENYTWKESETAPTVGTHSYKAIFNPIDNKNYNSVEFDIELRYIIVVAKPVLTNEYNYYTGASISPIWQRELENCFIKGENDDALADYSQTNEGEYIITVSLTDGNYVWSDHTTTDLQFTFTIEDTPFSSIMIDNEEVSLDTFESYSEFKVGTNLTFVLLDGKTMTINGESVSIIDNTVEHIVSTDNSTLAISVQDGAYQYNYNIYLIDKLTINNTEIGEINLANNVINFEVPITEESLIVSVPESFNYNMSYTLELNGSLTAIENNTFTISDMSDLCVIYITFDDYSDVYITINITKVSAIQGVVIEFFDLNTSESHLTTESEYSSNLTLNSNNEYQYTGGLITNIAVNINELYSNCTYKFYNDTTEFTTFNNLNNLEKFEIKVFDENSQLIDTVVVNCDVCNMLGVSTKNYISNINSKHYQDLYVQTADFNNITISTKFGANILINNGQALNYFDFCVDMVTANISFTYSDTNYTFDTHLLVNCSQSLSAVNSNNITIRNSSDPSLELVLNCQDVADSKVVLTDEQFELYSENGVISCSPKDGYTFDADNSRITTIKGVRYLELVFLDSTSTLYVVYSIIL